MATHTTRPGQATPRCWDGTGSPPAGTVVAWQTVLDTQTIGFDCTGCRDDIRDGYRPRWVDEALWP